MLSGGPNELHTSERQNRLTHRRAVVDQALIEKAIFVTAYAHDSVCMCVCVSVLFQIPPFILLRARIGANRKSVTKAVNASDTTLTCTLKRSQAVRRVSVAGCTLKQLLLWTLSSSSPPLPFPPIPLNTPFRVKSGPVGTAGPYLCGDVVAFKRLFRGRFFGLARKKRL